MRRPTFNKTSFVSASLVALTSSAFAQNVVPVEMTGQPLQYMADGKVSACGLRITAVRVAKNNRIDAVEASVNIDARGRATVKAVAYKPATAVEFAKGPVSVKVKSAWVRAAGAPATTPAGGTVLPGDDNKSILFGTSFDSAWGVIEAHLKESPIQMAVRREGEPSEWVLSGKVALERRESEQLRQCIEELSSAMEQSLAR